MQDEINCSIHIPIIRVMIYLVYEKKDLIAETDSIDFVKKLVKKNPDCRVKEATTDKILESTMPIRLLNNWKSRRDFGEYCPYQSAPRPSATINSVLPSHISPISTHFRSGQWAMLL